jgi:ATP-binding cassette subfamily B (MDR/TAP) protein 9
VFIRKKEASHPVDVGEENWGIMASIRQLKESQRKLVGLVGYDSSLLVPAFSYLIAGALFKSIIPHFYSACISCVAAGEARGKLLLALGGLSLSSVLEALFTGLRGALFWIAGEFIPCLRSNNTNTS